MFKYFFYTLFTFILFGCQKETLPKPKGELRLEYPSPKYLQFNSSSPYTFEYSDFAQVSPAKRKDWYNLYYPKMKANVFITYFPVNKDLNLHIKEAEKMVYEHTIKASSIETKSFNYQGKKIWGNFYELKGESASNIQFFITDSTKNFVTGSLYFNTRPKPDSLIPAVNYIKADLLHLIDTFKFK